MSAWARLPGHDRVGLGITDEVSTIPFSPPPRQKSGAEAVQAGEPHVRRGGDDNVGDHAPFQQLIRSANTTLGTPPSASKERASISKVVAAFSSLAKRTKRQRLNAATAQKICKLASDPRR